MEIAAALRTARNYRKITQADVAKSTGLTYQAISNFERGVNRVESMTLRTLCSLYQVSVESVLDCKFWEKSYLEDFENARSDEERRTIFRALGPCPNFICQYNDLMTEKEASSDDEDGLSLNVIKLAGRDGTFVERKLTDSQLALFKSMLDQLPPIDDENI